MWKLGMKCGVVEWVKKILRGSLVLLIEKSEVCEEIVCE